MASVIISLAAARLSAFLYFLLVFFCGAFKGSLRQLLLVFVKGTRSCAETDQKMLYIRAWKDGCARCQTQQSSYITGLFPGRLLISVLSNFLQVNFRAAHIIGSTAALYCVVTALRFGFAAVAQHVFK